ncbi:MAG: FecR domain-containing protein [Lentisphaeraceae bacterium]|nr:FecR domain-containing protein [Lentisphaeraceae bacterium]
MTKEELFNRYLDHQLSSEALIEFKKLLETEGGREEFYRYIKETTTIAHHLKQTSNEEFVVDEALTSLVQKSEQHLIQSLREKPIPVKEEIYFRSTLRPKHLLAFAALIFLSLGSLFFFEVIRVKEFTVQKDSGKAVARITKLNGVSNLKEGQWIKPGEVYLESGELELSFDSGARVLLQDKTKLLVEDENRAFLKSGILSAYVPKEAKGFVVNTAKASIVDLGTEFSVIAEDERIDIHVFTGQVEVISESSSLLVDEGKGASVAIKGRISEKLSKAASAVVRVDRSKIPLKSAFIYWPFENESGQGYKDQGNGGFGAFYDLTFGEKVPTLSSGKYGNGLVFSGKKEYLQSEFKGIGGASPRTISFWLKLPPDLNKGEHYAMVAWGKIAPTEKWQLGINLIGNNGVKGAIRTEFSKGYVVGVTDLRDGRWHHISSVFIGGDDADVATHVKHYVDGKLEGVSGYQAIKINTATSGEKSKPAFIGKYINHDKWYMRAAIDELYIFDRALTPAQITLLRDSELKPE